ncbi:cation efflux family protein [Antricoccus suffuscus]|uniref:Cation efflux family protein n=1 Tax=Antricoccus suffuscus TaxID=1629062 RepID=A0A2T0ZYS0_9ACTN|nr:cation transporter [Antricoccus suffuscus]PRZ41238.1 cation efflux family protein [Antricoccus suffuscus]
MSTFPGKLSTRNLPVTADPARREALARHVRWMVAATITYNVIEAAVAIAAGRAASSTALIGFGLDSVIEVSSAAAVAWQFSARDSHTREAREQRALRIIAVSFFALAAYVAVESIRSLLGDSHARESTVGLALAALSLLIMPALSYAQRRAGRQLGSASAVADSKQTLLCTYLSAVVLLGLALNATLGWTWADPVAALVIAAIAVKEGISAWHGDTCCPTLAGSTVGAAPSCSGDCECCGAIGAASSESIGIVTASARRPLHDEHQQPRESPPAGRPRSLSADHNE